MACFHGSNDIVDTLETGKTSLTKNDRHEDRFARSRDPIKPGSRARLRTPDYGLRNPTPGLRTPGCQVPNPKPRAPYPTPDVVLNLWALRTARFLGTGVDGGPGGGYNSRRKYYSSTTLREKRTCFSGGWRRHPHCPNALQDHCSNTTPPTPEAPRRPAIKSTFPFRNRSKNRNPLPPAGGSVLRRCAGGIWGG